MSSKSPPPPDYTPVAKASEESAKIMAALGNRQIDFAERQYEEAKPILKQITDNQLGISNKTEAQGDDYYAYLKTFRPTEQALMAESGVDRSGEIAAYDEANRADAATLTADDATVYGLNRGQIDARVGGAIADTEEGYTRAVNQSIRQGLRYGGSNSEIGANTGDMAMTQASRIAAAANGTRTAATEEVRGRAGTGLQLRQANMGALNKERAIDWAKKLDAAGLVKGLPGASQGAYGLAVSSGNSAGNNALAAGNNFQGGLAAGASTIGTGRQLKQSGLGAILGSQTSLYQPPADNTGAIVGGVAGIAVAVI